MVQNRFREAFESGSFVVSVEAVPGRGAVEPAQIKTLEEAVEIWNTGLVDAISITDSPSGTPALLADSFATDLLSHGVVPLVHMTCKDRNRNQIESQLYGMQRAGIENLLCMTGDAPTGGWMGQARPVFDLDPVTMTQLVCDMNEGMAYPRGKKLVRTQPSNFFPGAVVSPFKWTEGEVFTQFYKLKKKVAAGARFIVSQVGYDARKMQEMLMLVRDAGIDVPLVANIFVLNAGTAAFMHRGGVPGCDVSDELLEVVRAEKELPDAFLRRCIFHYIDFPDEEKIEEIIRVHFGDLDRKLVRNAIKAFYDIRSMKQIMKKPSTSELLDWIQALQLTGVDVSEICEHIPYIGVLLKKNQDIDYVKAYRHVY